MIELINTETYSYKGKIYVTDNAYEVMRYLIGREEDTRLLYDQRINMWYIGDAAEHIHRSFVIEGWKNGLYYDFDFKTEDDILYYFGNNEFIFIYYYKNEPFKPNLTGDYGVHYIYDFGILDSHDILNTTKISFEDTELYQILLLRLRDMKKEAARKEV